MLTRRRFLELGIASCLSHVLPGCVDLATLQPNCPISWAPSLLDPVFYGYKDLDNCSCSTCAPCSVLEAKKSLAANALVPGQEIPAMRVYYPSLDGSPNGADILSMCERFPLVLFIHGDCSGNPYDQWIVLPAQLARCGYVVAVTKYGGVLADGDPAKTAQLRQAEAWLRNNWEHKDRLMPPPHTAVIGHSYGATLGAQLAKEIPVMAFASLSGTFGQTQGPQTLLSAIRVPSLFCWNNNDDLLVGAALDVPPNHPLWSSIGTPKHGVIFNGSHGDYMMNASAPRCSQDGPCNEVQVLAADFVTTFISKYLPPEFDFAAFTWVPNSLIVRPQKLPTASQQGFYAGAFLVGFSNATESSPPPSKPCVENVRWQTSWSTGSTFLASS